MAEFSLVKVFMTFKFSLLDPGLKFWTKSQFTYLKKKKKSYIEVRFWLLDKLQDELLYSNHGVYD